MNEFPAILQDRLSGLPSMPHRVRIPPGEEGTVQCRFVAILPWIAEYSPYALVSSDDPPIFLYYRTPPAMGQDQKDPTHTSNFGVKLQEHCKANQVTCDLFNPEAEGIKYTTTQDYLIATLKGKRP